MSDLLGQLYIKKILRYALYLVLALIIQNMIFARIKIMGVCPFWLPAVVVGVGMFESPGAGVAFGLIMGFFADMAFIENTILFTVLFPALAFFSSFLSQFYINRRFFAFMGLALAAEFATAFVQMLFCFVGDTWSSELINTALLQTLWSMPFAALAYVPPARWINR